MADKFSVTPYEELPLNELGIEELESRLEMSTTNTSETEVWITAVVEY